MASSYYDLQSWQTPLRQNAWDQTAIARPVPGTSREEVVAFGPQFEEVDRAIDNLMKSGKLIRRDQFVAPGRQFGDHRQGSRPQSMDFDPMRAASGNNLQNFYGNARYPPRAPDGDSMQQAKRRMAAQRERELRNYHQEQQYNRSISSQGRSERSTSPNTMNEEDRRDLLARQHKALYGDQAFYDKPAYQNENQAPRTINTSVSGNETGPTQDPRSGTESNASPATGANAFGTFDPQTAAQQSSRTSNSSPGESPPHSTKPGAVPGAIGTRPSQATNPIGVKRNTPPTSSSTGFGFGGDGNTGDRSTSAISNPPSGRDSMTSSGNWGTGSSVWGKGSLSGVSSTVWG